ncbi:MAG: F390 synthetase-related protein [Candidatus Uhrbacteria bacterium]
MDTFRDYFFDFETKFFLPFLLFCKYRFSFWSLKDIQAYQQKRTRKIAEYAMRHTKYFHTLYSGHDLERFESLPTVNKKIMMENLTDANTFGFTKEEIDTFCLEIDRTRDFSKRLHGFNIGMSSGTSGNKGVAIISPREEQYMKAALLARFDFPKHEKIILAFILRVSAPAFNLDKFGHKLTYISQMNTIEEISKQLNALQPNVISAPASMLKLIAKEIEHGKLSVHPIRVISYAEVLHPDVKEYIETVFACPVHQVYQCTEGPIAISCKHGSLHINEDLMFVETLNLDGTVTPPGQPCQKFIVTDLHKTSQPIIRYELNDLVTISPDACACGSAFRVITSIQGRSDDLFWAKHTETHAWQFIFPDYISRAIITSSDAIDEFQVIQNAPDDILLRLELKNGINPSQFDQNPTRHKIEQVFLDYHCPAPSITISFEKPEANKRSQKLIRIHRNFALSSYDAT